MADTIKQAIEESAKGPARASGDSHSIEQHKLTDQIAADQYVSGKTAASNKTLGMRFRKLVPPGAD